MARIERTPAWLVLACVAGMALLDARPISAKPADAESASAAKSDQPAFDARVRAAELDLEVIKLRAENNHEKALESANAAVALKERAFGTESGEVARGVLTIASILLDTAQYARAEQDYRRAITLLEKLGPAPTDLALAYHDLAVVQTKLGKWADARALVTRGLGLKDADELLRMSLLKLRGDIDFALGDPNSALQDYQAAYQLAQNQKSPFSGVLLSYAAEAKAELQDAQGARANYARALEELEYRARSGSIELGNVLAAFASFEASQGNFAEATNLYLSSLAFLQGYPARPLVLAGVRHDFGVLYRTVGNFTEAEAMLNLALSDRIATLADQPLSVPVLASRIELAESFAARGDYRRARDQLASAYGKADTYREALTAEPEGRVAFDMESMLWFAQGELLDARLWLDTGERSEAEQHAKAAGAWLRRLGATVTTRWLTRKRKRLDVLYAVVNAQLYALGGDFDRASSTLTTAETALLGMSPEARGVLAIAIEQARLYFSVARKSKTQALFYSGRAIAKTERLFGKEHPLRAELLLSRGALLALSNEELEGAALSHAAVTILREVESPAPLPLLAIALRATVQLYDYVGAPPPESEEKLVREAEEIEEACRNFAYPGLGETGAYVPGRVEHGARCGCRMPRGRNENGWFALVSGLSPLVLLALRRARARGGRSP